MIRLSHYQVTNLIAGIIGVEALVVMAGWIFGIDQLTHIAPIGGNMQFITAFLFLLSALGLFCISRVIQYEGEVARLLLPGIFLTIFLVTVTLLVGRMLGTPTGIEDLFLERLSPVYPLGSLQTAGWPSFPAMLNFILFGLAGIASLFPRSFRDRLFKYLGTIILSFGLIALIGYACNIPVLYYEWNVSAAPMALNCAVSFFLLGFGLMRISRPEKSQ